MLPKRIFWCKFHTGVYKCGAYTEKRVLQNNHVLISLSTKAMRLFPEAGLTV